MFWACFLPCYLSTFCIVFCDSIDWKFFASTLTYFVLGGNGYQNFYGVFWILCWPSVIYKLFKAKELTMSWLQGK